MYIVYTLVTASVTRALLPGRSQHSQIILTARKKDDLVFSFSFCRRALVVLRTCLVGRHKCSDDVPTEKVSVERKFLGPHNHFPRLSSDLSLVQRSS